MYTFAARSRTLRRFALLAAITALGVSASASWAGNIRLTVTTVTPTSGSTVSGSIPWQVSVSGGTASSVTFAVDGTVKWTSTASPYVYGGSSGLLDTKQLTNGSHQLVATAYGGKGPTGKSSVTVTVANNSPAPDVTKPSDPSGLAVSGTTGSSLTLAWSPSTDNVGVAGYGLYLNGVWYGWTAGATSYVFSGLSCGTTYMLGVDAYDAAGNRSAEMLIWPSTSSCAAPAPPSCPSGECMPVGDLSGWKQVFTDDFSSNVALGGFSNCDAYWRQCFGLPADVKAKWFAYPDGWKDGAYGVYMPSKVMSIQNGLMNLYLHSENGVHMVSTPQPLIPGAVGSAGGMLYGRYAIRFRADLVVGYKTSFMLWPDSGIWPGDGEIDFPEGDLGGTQYSTMYAFLHHQGATSSSDADWFGSGVPYGNWHTAIIEWMPDHVAFILDGRVIGTSTSRIPNTPMHWILQTPTNNGLAPSNTAAGNVQIDWVAVWKPA